MKAPDDRRHVRLQRLRRPAPGPPEGGPHDYCGHHRPNCGELRRPAADPSEGGTHEPACRAGAAALSARRGPGRHEGPHATSFEPCRSSPHATARRLWGPARFERAERHAILAASGRAPSQRSPERRARAHGRALVTADGARDDGGPMIGATCDCSDYAGLLQGRLKAAPTTTADTTAPTAANYAGLLPGRLKAAPTTTATPPPPLRRLRRPAPHPS